MDSTMEITLVSKNSFRIKGKQISFIVDPEKSEGKGEYNAKLFLTNSLEMAVLPKEDGSSLIIYSPGDYEVAGVKITAIKQNGGLLYDLTVDGVKMLIGSSLLYTQLKDKLDEHHVALIKVDSEIDEAAITNVAPSIVLLYGDKAVEQAKVLQKDTSGVTEGGSADIKPVSKFSTSLDKLPAETQVVLLG
ncbi:MAG: hypothetical protein HYT10_00535 [Candidatus Levybacteria bacterium]|nr:hypothetical protein [Candidatus Levybacteria bacterium]